MWIVFGNKEKSERVPGGQAVQRHCEHCGETAMFYERQAVSTFQLYFIDILDYGKRTVMACGACGTLYATDEVARTEQPKTSAATLSPVEATLGDIKTAAKAAHARLSTETAKLVSRVRNLDAPTPGAEAEPSYSDPLAEEDQATEERFRELERKYRVSDS